jgi:hypothetical protein
MAQTKEGQNALKEMGEALASVFAPVAEALANVLVPALQSFAELVSSGLGKLVLFGSLGVLAVRALTGSLAALKAAFVGVTGAISALGIALAAVGVFALASGGGKSDIKKQFEDLAKQVRAGQVSMEEAKKQVDAIAAGHGYEVEKGARTGPFGAILSEEQVQTVTGGAVEKQRQKGYAEVEAGGKGRSEVTLARTGKEDIRATLDRIQAESLKSDKPEERSAKSLEIIQRLLEGALPDYSRPTARTTAIGAGWTIDLCRSEQPATCPVPRRACLSGCK